MASCNSTDILATAYRNGYAKLSARDLMVAAIASACSTCNAQPLIEAATGLGYLKLSEFDAAMCIAESLCSSPGVTAAPAPTILKLAIQDHLAAMSRRDLDGVIAALLCKMTNPPCVTPATPGTPAAFSTLNNILKISWAQPPNSGSLILNYTVSYGTTQGGPYTSTITVPAMTKQAILNGLTSGTTYYFVVVANSFAGCSSAASAEGSGTTTGTPAICNSGLTFANAWATRVVANGGAAPSQATINAIANFQCGLITDGLDTLMISWNAIVPDNLIAAKTPQLVGAGGDDPWNDGGGFAGADLTINGLKANGNPGSAKQMATGLNPTTIYASDNDGGLTFYAFDNDNGNNATAGLTAAGIMDLQMFGGTTFSDCYGAGTGRISAANAGFTGYVSGNRTAANAHAIYEASSTVPHNTLVSGAGASNTARPNNGGPGIGQGINFWAIGGGGSFSDQRLSFCAVHSGLTSAQSALFFARIQALRQALGGGWV